MRSSCLEPYPRLLPPPPHLSSCRVHPYHVRSSRRGGTGGGCGHSDVAQRDGCGDMMVVSGDGGDGVKGGGSGGKGGGVVVVVLYTVKL